MQAVNLARKRFVNSRPVTRLAVLLWLAGVSLLAANLWFYYGYFVGRGASSARLLKVEQQLTGERDRLRELEGEVGKLDLVQRNERAVFLNSKISERSFSWSLLFDRLAEVLPGEVRLVSLSPSTAEEGPRDPGERNNAELVELMIRGEAKDTESMLKFINQLFAHEAFVNPNLKRDSLDRGVVAFELEAQYWPAAELETTASVGGQP